MRRLVLEFLRRGLMACGIGPVVLAILYLILQKQGALETLTVNQVCIGIFSLMTLSFAAGGMNVLYQMEQLPLMVAILIHGGILYIGYLATYLMNGWLEWGTTPVLVFTVFFVLGYFTIWAIIYSITKKNTDKINRLLKEKRQEKRRCPDTVVSE